MCMEQGLLQWNVVRKHHLLAHMADQAQFLAHACLNGTPGHRSAGGSG